LERTKPSENGLLTEHRRACLDVNVSPASLERALRIIDAVIGGFEAEGFAVAVERDVNTSTYALIKGEKICFSMSEDYQRIDHILTQEEEAKKKARPYWEIKKYDYHPTGELSLRIENSGTCGYRKTWSDSKTGKIEDKVGKFIGGAILVAHVLKTERQKGEENRRKWEEEHLQREEEDKRIAEEKTRLQELEATNGVLGEKRTAKGLHPSS